MQQYNVKQCCVLNYAVLIFSIVLLTVIIWVGNSSATSKNSNLNFQNKDTLPLQREIALGHLLFADNVGKLTL